jgi:hypothetical protein
MTLRGLVGALIGFVAALVLILCLTETRVWLGRSQWGIWWYSRWGRHPHFDSFLWPLAYLGPVGVLFGYFIADRVRKWPAMWWALAGAMVVTTLGWLIPAGGGRVHHERAIGNMQWMLAFTLIFLGAALGAGLWDRFSRRRGADDRLQAP